MRPWWLASIAILGCATADEDVDAHPKDGSAPDVATDSATGDTGPVEDVSVDVIFPVDDVAVEKGLCATPSGTTITASGAYMSTPEMAIDGNLGTTWNSGTYTGSVRLKFPKAIRFDRVRVAANAVPACDETYTLTGYKDGAPTALGTATRSISGAGGWVPTIEVPVGTWDELSIEIAKADSWITLAEVVVFDSTAGCGIP